MKHFLIFDCGFNEVGAAEVVEEFKATAEFAKLFKSAMGVDNSTTQSEVKEAMPRSETAAEPVRPAPSPIYEADSSDDDGVWMRGPLSDQTKYKIVIKGKMGPKEIGKLIKVLEAQKMVLEDDQD